MNATAIPVATAIVAFMTVALPAGIVYLLPAPHDGRGQAMDRGR
jgi:hypothetical protein